MSPNMLINISSHHEFRPPSFWCRGHAIHHCVIINICRPCDRNSLDLYTRTTHLIIINLGCPTVHITVISLVQSRRAKVANGTAIDATHMCIPMFLFNILNSSTRQFKQGQRRTNPHTIPLQQWNLN